MSALALQAFGFEDQLVRVLDRDGAPWFVAQDVCACLEIVNHRDATAALDEDERDCVGITDAMDRERSTTVVSESGVYVLIFKSRKAAAVRFRKWVTQEVLPTLRRTGRFEVANDSAGDGPPPLAADEFEMRRLVLAVSVVKEARQVWGRSEARQIWVDMGLPDPRESRARSAAIAVERSGGVPDSILEWIVACTRPEPGALTPVALLYRSYTEHCAGQEVTPENPTKFGLSLNALGHLSVKNGTVSRKGLVLTEV